MTGPRTCERCRWWRARIVEFGRMATVCHCTKALEHYMMQTGAAATCDQWASKRSTGPP